MIDIDLDLEETVEEEVRLFPPHHVIIQNDDHHSMEFVLAVLMEVFRYPQERCFQLMMEAHEKGLAIVWTGPKEVAELKLEQITTFHEGPKGPLGAYIEASV